MVIPLCSLSFARKLRLARRAEAAIAAPAQRHTFLTNLAEQKGEANVLPGPVAAPSVLWSADVEVRLRPFRRIRLGPTSAPAGWRNACSPLSPPLGSELSITSPYFIPGRKGTTRLRGHGTGVGSRSPYSRIPWRRPMSSPSTAPMQSIASRCSKAASPYTSCGHEIIRDGPSLFGSRGASLHTKAFTVDDGTGFVGSFNFDPRSASLNTEMGVIFEHEALAGEMRRSSPARRSRR